MTRRVVLCSPSSQENATSGEHWEHVTCFSRRSPQMGRRIVAAGEAPRPRSGRERNPWNESSPIIFSPRMGRRNRPRSPSPAPAGAESCNHFAPRVPRRPRGAAPPAATVRRPCRGFGSRTHRSEDSLLSPSPIHGCLDTQACPRLWAIPRLNLEIAQHGRCRTLGIWH
jgi:hypothetical protein